MRVSRLYACFAQLDLENPAPEKALNAELKRRVIGGNVLSATGAACSSLAIVLPDENGAILLMFLAVGIALSKAIEGLWYSSYRALASSTKLHLLVGVSFLAHGSPMLALIPLFFFAVDWLEAASAMVASTRETREIRSARRPAPASLLVTGD